LAIEVKFDANNYFYHATNDLFAGLITKKIIITKRKSAGVDFGPGFYLTQNEEQAINWATGKARSNGWGIPQKEVLEMAGMTIKDYIYGKNTLKPVIIKYEVKDHDYWATLIRDRQFLLFDRADEDWKHHVWTWRTATDPPEDWVATFGPLADGGLYTPSPSTVRAFPGLDQLAIHNEELANTYLDFLEVISC
jgi:hypothetical protein